MRFLKEKSLFILLNIFQSAMYHKMQSNLQWVPVSVSANYQIWMVTAGVRECAINPHWWWRWRWPYHQCWCSRWSVTPSNVVPHHAHTCTSEERSGGSGSFDFRGSVIDRITWPEVTCASGSDVTAACTQRHRRAVYTWTRWPSLTHDCADEIRTSRISRFALALSRTPDNDPYSKIYALFILIQNVIHNVS